MLKILFCDVFDDETVERKMHNSVKPVESSARHNYATPNRSKVVALCIGMVALTAIETANAAFLWWDKTPVHTASLKECFSVVQEAMQSLNYQNIRLSRDEVAGTSSGVYTAVTCIGTNPPTAMVMSVGDDQNATRSASERLSKRIGGTIHP
jgi:ABC-type ATPase with predicted acetyltransferase domain